MQIKSEIEYRCIKCHKLLAKGSWETATLEIKCNRCGKINSFFDNESDQVIITDNNGIILYVNQALLKLTGYTLDEAIGKTPGLWGGQMPKTFYQKLWKKIKDKKEVTRVEVENRKKDGKTYKAMLRISPILDAEGEPKFFLGIETKLDDNIQVVNHKKVQK